MNKFSAHLLLLAIALLSNSCSLLSTQIDPLGKTCNGLGIYYKNMGRNDYYDSDRIGLFTKWFKDEEMEIDEMDGELQDDNVEDCGYLEFDDNFPLKEKIDDKDEKERKIFEIIQHCYKYGKPPSNKKGKNIYKQTKKIRNLPNAVPKEIINKLKDAIEKGDLKVLESSDKQHIENLKTTYGENLLILACQHGQPEIVEFLLDKCGFSPEEKDSELCTDLGLFENYESKTAIFSAVQGGNTEVLDILIKRGARMKFQTHNLLLTACEAYNPEESSDKKKERIEVIKWLIKNSKCDEKTSKFYIDVNECSKGGEKETPFLWAAKHGQLEIAKLLKERGANINATDAYRNNALHLACLYSGNVNMVNFLLDKCGIEKESRGCNRTTPFLCAAQNGQLSIAKQLGERGANIHAKDQYGNNALHLACLYSKNGEMIMLSKYDKKLHFAYHDSKNRKMVDWLLNTCKIGIETKGNEENTPFLCAMKKGQFSLALLLKDRGANLNAANKYGNTALHFACMLGSVEMVTWLLTLKVIEIDKVGYEGKTPFLIAAEGGHLEIALLLKELGANLNAKNREGNNALHLACSSSGSGDVGMVAWLLDKEPGCGLDIESKGSDGKTPLRFAQEASVTDIIKLLKNRGANIYAK